MKTSKKTIKKIIKEQFDYLPYGQFFPKEFMKKTERVLEDHGFQTSGPSIDRILRMLRKSNDINYHKVIDGVWKKVKVPPPGELDLGI